MLADWFAQRTQDDAIVFTMFIDSDMIQVRTITDEIIPFQSGNALLLTRFKFVQLLMTLFPSNLEVHFTSA